MRAARPAARREDLDYFNARVRGMRGKLLGRAEYEPFLRLDSAGAVAERLRPTAYGPYIDAAMAKSEDPSEAVPSALVAALSDALGLVWKTAPPGARALLKAVFSDWEVFDLKTLVRGIAREVRREEIRAALIPAGEFDAPALSTLLTAKDPPDLVAFLDTWGSPYAAALRPGLAEYLRTGRTTDMELGATLHTHSLLLEALEGGFADSRLMRLWLSVKADLNNALTLLKISGEGYAAEAAAGFFLDGGRMKRRAFVEMAGMKDKEELMARLAATGPAVKRLVEAAGADPILVEEQAEHEMKERLRAMAAVDPLSIALPASFVYMKVREVKNLRLIARGADFGIPYEEMSRLVFYPL